MGLKLDFKEGRKGRSLDVKPLPYYQTLCRVVSKLLGYKCFQVLPKVVYRVEEWKAIICICIHSAAILPVEHAAVGSTGGTRYHGVC